MSLPTPQPIDLTRPRASAPVDRCCDSHPDWPTLTQHLISGFPAISLEEIVRAVAEAKTATDGMDLDGRDALTTGELLARQHLVERSGTAAVAQLAGRSHASGSAPTP